MVDLYGYMSMAVAALQAQNREIDGLKKEIARVHHQVCAKNVASRPRRARPAGWLPSRLTTLRLTSEPTARARRLQLPACNNKLRTREGRG